jgi:hypothetical protein
LALIDIDIDALDGNGQGAEDLAGFFVYFAETPNLGDLDIAAEFAVFLRGKLERCLEILRPKSRHGYRKRRNPCGIEGRAGKVIRMPYSKRKLRSCDRESVSSLRQLGRPE